MTIQQRIRRTKRKERAKDKGNILKPQLKGLTLKVYTMTPKKPSSALRKVANVKLIDKGGIIKEKVVVAYIPGERHALTVHNIVKLIPKRKKDLPGVKYTVVNPPRSK